MRLYVHQCGGLGNQLFHYAAGRYYARRYDARLEVLLEASYDSPHQRLSRPFLLSRFRIRAPLRTRSRMEEMLSDGRRRHRLPLTPWRVLTRTVFVPEALADRFTFKPSLPIPWYARHVHLAGFWQVHQMADALGADLRDELVLRQAPAGENARVLEAIRRCAAPVSLHVRRGDYENLMGEDLRLPVAYYRNALRYVRQHVPDPTFVVFSDEPDFARQNLPDLGRAIFVGHNDALSAEEDMRLMSCCRHHIIANSSFSWWGAWLNPDETKLVCAPDTWLESSAPFPDVLPPRWVRIDAAA